MRRLRYASVAAVMIILSVLIMFGAGSAAISSSAEAVATTQTLAVSSTTGWQETSLYLTAGQKFTVQYVSGCWTVDHRNFPCVGPEGYSSQEDAKIYQDCKFDGLNNYGILYGIVGQVANAAFPIGRGGTFTATAPGSHVVGAGNSGYLYLRINDTCLTDNSGSVTVRLGVLPAPTSTACPAAQVIGLHGMGEGPSPQKPRSYSSTIEHTLKALRSSAAHADVQTYDLPYPTTNWWTAAGIANDVQAGVKNLELRIAASISGCPQTPISLVGYSEGALVINNWMQAYNSQVGRIKALVLYGDPCSDNPYGTGSNGLTLSYRGLARIAIESPPILNLLLPSNACGPSEPFYPEPDINHSIPVRNFCIGKDPVCGQLFPETSAGKASQVSAVTQCLHQKSCPHYLYDGAETTAGGKWLAANSFN